MSDGILEKIRNGTPTEAEAIAHAVDRLQGFYGAILGVEPPMVDSPAHIRLLGLLPTRAEIEAYAGRVRQLQVEAHEARLRAETAERILRSARWVLGEALAHLAEHPEGGFYWCDMCDAIEPIGGDAQTNGAHDCGGHWRVFDPDRYHSDFGDDRPCKCGHPYYRHFDPYEDNDPVGCKYCACGTWQPPSPEPAR